MSINTYPNKTINELFGLEGQFLWPDDIDVIPEDAKVDTSWGFDMTGKTHTEETKKKIGMAHKGKVMSEESKKKISESTKGEKNPFYGKKHSKEARKKLSEKRKLYTGWNHSSETKKKISESMKRRLNK